MLIALVQGVVGAFDEDFGPFHQRGGEESGEGANDNLLEESGVHPVFESSGSAREPTLCKFAP